MASDDRRAVIPQAAVQRHANRMVADLLGEGTLRRRLETLWPNSDSEFTQELIDRELGWIANGVDPLRIRLRLAVLRTARDVLAAYAQIHRLPETPSTTCLRADPTADPSRRSLRAAAPGSWRATEASDGGKPG